MRSIGKIGLAALAALVAMSLAGATSASAVSTQLCTSNAGLTCGEGSAASTVHMTLAEGTVGELLAITPVLCLGFLVEASAGALAAPQTVTSTTQTFTGCGTSSSHNNCTITIPGGQQPVYDLLKTGLDEGTLTALSGQTRLVCTNLGLNCLYDVAGMEFSAGEGHLTAYGTATTELGGGFLCPSEGVLDTLLETLTTTYISGETPIEALGTSLCKTHSSEKCAKKDQVKSLHMVTTKPPVLYNTTANIECESSLGTAIVLGVTEPQKIDATELTWEGCHTQGAAENCTVTTESLPKLDLERTALNLGTVTTLGLEVGIDCTILGLFEMDCVYGAEEVTMQMEGALHKEGTGHGMLTASKVELVYLEGEEHCPESVKWNALYEPLEHVYIVG